ncbi:unnamed protein product [Blepharisma stoltei]|uniref:Uncharacterized protein n=1 Tax=Blepharisma stoltei TaxID=1481888 RepID=A0AAU9ITA7_9CILI|nr:unnamed protein product [Blepharisma stoltei]
MKLSQIFDNKVDQNEIKSKYLWNINQNGSKKIMLRVSLSKFKIDSSWKSSSCPIGTLNCIALPNNRSFGMIIEEENGIQYLFIADKYFNLKIIETPIKVTFDPRCFISCYYDNSIFIFENYFNLHQELGKANLAKRYFISQNKWILLTKFPEIYPTTCIGLNEKIILSDDTTGIWVYDIILDSYSYHIPIKTNNNSAEQIFIKASEKLYMIIRSGINEIYCCEDPLSEWHFVSSFNDKIFRRSLIPRVYYKDSIYFLTGLTLYEFSLKNFESKKVKKLIKEAFLT